MDPNETLATIRGIIQTLAEKEAAGGPDALTDEEERFSGAFRDLDEWLTGGGFRPLEWTNDDELDSVFTTGTCENAAERLRTAMESQDAINAWDTE